VEVGNIFKLGTKYTDALECGFSDENGQIRPVIMGSYGIGVGRLLACIAEQHHDENGLCWPAEVAPYPVHLTLLSGKTGEPDAVAQALAAELTAAGLEPLFDDRTESAGVKFADADLIGLPLRITVSERALKQGGVEFKPRRASERFIVPLENAVAAARQILGSGT
jgi:prolyl-tRNA synthetase